MGVEREGTRYAPVGTDLAAGAHALTGYHEVLEVLRSPKFVTENNDGTAAVRGAALLRVHGPAHTRRRRAMNHLTGQDHHRWFRETTLYPTLKANLEAVLRIRDEVGQSRADLVELLGRTNIQLAAAMIGLRPLDRTERFQELSALVDAFRPIAGVRWTIDPARKQEILKRAEAALRTFKEQFFLPALLAHRELLERYKAGELSKADLPRDFLTLAAAHSDVALVEELGARPDPSLANPDVAVQEAAITLINGAVDTTTFAVTWSFHELSAWFERHPEDRNLRTDEGFLRNAIWETLRLRLTFPAFVREATEDTPLPNGVQVKAGEMVALRFDLASRDHSVYGSDADHFNPRRHVAPGIMPYGLAFGSGPHMCYGIPIVLGNDGNDGSLVHILRACYQANMRRDPTRAPQMATGTHSERFASYPVLFGDGEHRRGQG
jgi:cytochrome P450